MEKIEKELIIKSTAGLHSKLAVEIVQAMGKYNVDIRLHYNDKVVDMKSILGLMSLAIPKGANVKVVATGEFASQAIKDIERVLK